MKSMWRLALLMTAILTLGNCVSGRDGPETSEKPPVRVTISKETTYITEPLRKDGYVDYAAALDRRFQEGVTPENNAAVPMLKAIGLAEIKQEYREDYCRRLGIEPLPEKGDYLLSLADYAIGLKDVEKPAGESAKEWYFILGGQLDQAMKRPWSKQEFPRLADWLAVNEKPLSLILQASKRPRRYSPLISGNSLAADILLPFTNQYREIARILAARAMLRLGDGKVDEAWEDLLAGHRWARLIGQGPFFVDSLIAIVVDNITATGDQALLQHSRLTAAQIERMRADLARLPPTPRVADKIEIGERFFFLENVGTVAREGSGLLSALTDPVDSKGSTNSLVDAGLCAATDWDQVLRMGNAWCDRTVDACRKPVLAERYKELQAIGLKLPKTAASAKDAKSWGLLLLSGNRENITKKVGESWVSSMLSSVGGYALAEDRWAMRCEITQLAFALAAYRADHGSYPAKLAELKPKYAAEIPEDIFSAAEPRYRQNGQGYLLYSVGPNGKDDGGKGVNDCKTDEGWDDIAVRAPASRAEGPVVDRAKGEALEREAPPP